MFKKFFFSLLLLLILIFVQLFIPACSSAPSQDDIVNDVQVEGFVGGITGLKFGVISGAPPSVIVDRGEVPFSFIMEIENVGEVPVGPGTSNPLVFARITGILYDTFGLTKESAAKTLGYKLESAKRNFDGSILPGEISEIGFDNLAYKYAVPDSMAITLRGELCYDYESLATVKFCMKKDLFESYEDASICTLKGPKPVGNSGSPLHITRVEETPISKDTVQINFVIEHLGNGVFFYRNTPKDLFDTCVFDEFNADIYKMEVIVEPVEPDLYDIKCMRFNNTLEGGAVSGVIKMYESAPLTISCFIKRIRSVEVRIYQDLLNIRLKYRYGSFVEVPVLVQSHP